MVSSGIYRYFARRDELLTALIIEAYDSLGQQAEEAPRRHRPATASGPLGRRRPCPAGWAIANPHEYALVYGTPVPGYEAPETRSTRPPARRWR